MWGLVVRDGGCTSGWGGEEGRGGGGVGRYIPYTHAYIIYARAYVRTYAYTDTHILLTHT